MNKEHFNQLVADYAKLNNEFKDLEKLIKDYPYSQPVRMLNLQSSAGLNKAEFQKRLSLAAFHVTDRTVLRSLIETGKVSSDIIGSSQDLPSQPKKSSKATTKTVKTQRKIVDAGQLRQEVMENLALLQETKASFLKLADLEPAKPVKKKATGKAAKATKKPPATEPAPAKKTTEKKTAKLKEKNASGPGKPTSKEIIDKFIANEPRITPKKALQENQSDLSRASSELKEDLVSENLAIIFAKQGKTTKAIEIYKKLIWKFPQKKASFAARIEELKKKK